MDCTWLNCVVFIECFLFLCIYGQSRDYFEKNCPKNNDGYRKCKLNVITRLDFNDFKGWARWLPYKSKIILDVSCSSGGRFLLPHPMKAKGLKILRVKGCVIEGFFSNFAVQSNLLDELQVLELENCAIMSNIHNILDITLKPLTQEYDCGQQTVRRDVRRNITYIFPPQRRGKNLADIELSHLLELGDVILQKAQQLNYKCKYSNLEYLVNSANRNLGKHHFLLMTAYSDYPKLKTLVVAKDGLSSVPKEFTKWYTNFPELRHLDLSRNSISSFDFLGTPNTGTVRRTDPLLVCLSNNSVSTIPFKMADYLSNSIPIIVDLTDNPLTCNCDFLRYKNYVIEAVQRYPQFSYLTDIQCYSENLRAWIKLKNYDDSGYRC